MSVLNKHRMRPGQGGVYCGRGSKWGNPFVMQDKSQAERDRVCDAFERYLHGQHQLLRELDELSGQDLICFCAPQRCHCDLLHHLANADRHDRVNWFKRVRDQLA